MFTGLLASMMMLPSPEQPRLEQGAVENGIVVIHPNPNIHYTLIIISPDPSIRYAAQIWDGFPSRSKEHNRRPTSQGLDLLRRGLEEAEREMKEFKRRSEEPK